jgi:hypothetical protein
MPDQATQVVGQTIGWRRLKAFIGLVFVVFAGCFGPQSMHWDIQEYNKQVVSSEKEMLLYNIGALHYKQPPHFMMLSSVSQTRMFSASAAFQWTHLWNSLFIAPSTISAVTTNGSNSWQAGPFTAGAVENPTIQFVPIQGQDFANRFESPLTDKFATFLEDRRWSASVAEKQAILMLMVQSIGLTHGDITNQGSCDAGTHKKVFGLHAGNSKG